MYITYTIHTEVLNLQALHSQYPVIQDYKHRILKNVLFRRRSNLIRQTDIHEYIAPVECRDWQW